MRDGDSPWKAVQTKGELAVYDLSKDIGEENDVSGENPEVAARFAKIIAELE